MKINILFDITTAPRGGGNQFLQGLKKAFIKKNVYTDIQEADVVLFNSYQYIQEVLKAKKIYPDKLFVHRVDGPIRLYNRLDDRRDEITNITNEYLADATVYQSEWSQRANLEMGLKHNTFEDIIMNAVDDSVFNRKNLATFSKKSKVKIVACSWSSNVNKGFDVYHYLDEVLDFSKYEMIFIGNSSDQFRNIRVIGPKASRELAEILKQQDIYITASKKDPCSNSLIEALACGLPAICFADGGHPEILGEAGYLFENPVQIPQLLDCVVENYFFLQEKIRISNMSEAADKYINFFNNIINMSQGYRKKLTLYGKLNIEIALLKWRYLK